METVIGKVTHYYPRVGVAAIVLSDHIAWGGHIHILGPHDDIHQTITSMEFDHNPIVEADPGQDIGIRVSERVHEGDMVYREY